MYFFILSELIGRYLHDERKVRLKYPAEENTRRWLIRLTERPVSINNCLASRICIHMRYSDGDIPEQLVISHHTCKKIEHGQKSYSFSKGNYR